MQPQAKCDGAVFTNRSQRSIDAMDLAQRDSRWRRVNTLQSGLAMQVEPAAKPAGRTVHQTRITNRPRIPIDVWQQ